MNGHNSRHGQPVSPEQHRTQDTHGQPKSQPTCPVGSRLRTGDDSRRETATDSATTDATIDATDSATVTACVHACATAHDTGCADRRIARVIFGT